MCVLEGVCGIVILCNDVNKRSSGPERELQYISQKNNSRKGIIKVRVKVRVQGATANQNTMKPSLHV